MPKPRKNDSIQCTHFAWRLSQRHGIFYADGRSNATPRVGRHSLATSDRQEALRNLAKLDQQRAEELGLVPRTAKTNDTTVVLPLADGRKLYEAHANRPRVAGGIKPSTSKKYRSVFDKFEVFTGDRCIESWNVVTDDVLANYARHLEAKGYAPKSIRNELVTLKQVIKWLVTKKHVVGLPLSQLPIRKIESEPAYCYRTEEVTAMIKFCRTDPALIWLADVIVAFACTGLRSAELASLRWKDVETVEGMLILTDESGHREREGHKRRHVKSSRSRSFPIHPDWAAVLLTLPRKDAYIYHGPRGGRLKPDTVCRILKRDVISPLSEQFPSRNGERGFADGRVHSFRHYFCSMCANSSVPERMVMDWLGHADSEMVRLYYHLHDEESRRRMNQINFLGGASGRSTSAEEANKKEDVEPPADDVRKSE